MNSYMGTHGAPIEQPPVRADSGIFLDIRKVCFDTKLASDDATLLVWAPRGGRISVANRARRSLQEHEYVVVPSGAEIFVQPAGQPAYFFSLGANPLMLQTIVSELRSVSKLGLGEILPELLAAGFGLASRRSQPDWMVAALTEIETVVGSGPIEAGWLQRFGRLVWERLIYSAALTVTSPARGTRSPRARLLATRLSRVRRMLEEQYTVPLTVKDMASCACVSPFHFVRQFRVAYGQTPYQMLIRIRLRKARRLLEEGALSVHEISRRVGFSTPDSFYRAFRRRYRLSPSEYRGNGLTRESVTPRGNRGTTSRPRTSIRISHPASV